MDPRRKAGFLSDRDYPFCPPPPPARPVAPRRARQPSPPAPPEDDAALDFYNEEAKYDFVESVFHVWQMVMEERREFQLPKQ
jgi:hypothetical protein